MGRRDIVVNTLLCLIDIRRTGKVLPWSLPQVITRFYLTLLFCISFFFFFASLKFYLPVRKKESEKRSALDAVENQVRMRTKNSRENACIRMSSVKHQLRYMFS